MKLGLKNNNQSWCRDSCSQEQGRTNQLWGPGANLSCGPLLNPKLPLSTQEAPRGSYKEEQDNFVIIIFIIIVIVSEAKDLVLSPLSRL